MVINEHEEICLKFQANPVFHMKDEQAETHPTFWPNIASEESNMLIKIINLSLQHGFKSGFRAILKLKFKSRSLSPGLPQPSKWPPMCGFIETYLYFRTTWVRSDCYTQLRPRNMV